MSGADCGAEIIGNSWQECASWLTRCKALRSDHRANWPTAKAVDLAYILRDGVLLCNLLNNIESNCIDSKDVNQKPQMAQFLCLRNINAFLSACSNIFGLSESDLFEPTMLFDLSNFYKVLCTLSVLSNTPRFKSKGIEGFTVKRGRSQEDIYKDLQSGVGRENEGWRRRFWRRDGGSAASDEGAVGADHNCRNDLEAEEGGFGALSSHARSEKVYHDLCSLNLPPPLPASQVSVASAASVGIGGEKRDYVVQELIETERNYAEVLNSLLRYFARPLSSLITPEDSNRIFFGIKDLAEIHAGFHSQLRKARDGAGLAQVFLDWREKFLIYGDYCANLTTAQNAVHEVCENETVRWTIEKCQKEANNGKFKLRDILSVPMQRVLKYHLLLDKLVEETPREWVEDIRLLTQAREVMVDVAQYINEVKRDSDTIDIIRDIQESIVDWERSEDFQLKNYGRLLKDGELKIKAHGDQRIKARYAFVFEQVVLVCKAGRGDVFCYRETIRLDEYRVEDPSNRKILGRDSRWSFQWLLVQNKNKQAYTLYARSEDQKQMWIKALQDAMDNIYPAACRNTNHKFKLTTFDSPRSCERCGKFLKGRIFQGYKCDVCRLSVHKQCIVYSGRCVPMPPVPPSPPSPSPQPFERELSAKLWYVGEMGRDAAATKLEQRENGTYMVRIRPPTGHPRLKDETNYALSIKADDVVRHIRIFKREVDGADLYYLSESRFFKSVVELVEYYERVSLAENFENLDQRLLWPFRRVLAKALFDYRGGERNQLSLRKGCRVVVLSKEGEAKGWWKGKIGDQVGFFPKEYVEEE
ncbi:protein vav isoform X1 [Copidosoma floridanum]|uniref:protein vav isoform X1 n=1 Tax=Copidosoma floridanum TaxID=29053 RepID=UPI0006C93E6B|nr:protein vav isoform X1 [Copidosoma floridanum]XP_014206931.1 protein vav isoform X1 [Copidosoma floridanum]